MAGPLTTGLTDKPMPPSTLVRDPNFGIRVVQRNVPWIGHFLARYLSELKHRIFWYHTLTEKQKCTRR